MEREGGGGFLKMKLLSWELCQLAERETGGTRDERKERKIKEIFSACGP